MARFLACNKDPNNTTLAVLERLPHPFADGTPPCAPLWCIRPFRNATECVNGEGQTSWFLADGANAAYTSSSSGTEYDGVFPSWNWNKVSRLQCP